VTALAADMVRVLQSGRDIAPISVQVLASTTIYDGSAVMNLAASHYARPVAVSATGQFLGFAQERKTAGATQAAAPTVLIWQQGKIQVPNIITTWWETAAIVTADVGKPVYMIDDGTGFTLTITGNRIPIGKIDNLDLIEGFVTVAFQSFAMRSI